MQNLTLEKNDGIESPQAQDETQVIALIYAFSQLARGCMNLPPSITGKPNYGSTALTQASGNPGHMAQASAGIREAAHILSAEVSKLAPGSEQQLAVMDCIKKLSKLFPDSQASTGVQKTAALEMAQNAQQGNPMMALLRAFGSQGGEQPQQPQQNVQAQI